MNQSAAIDGDRRRESGSDIDHADIASAGSADLAAMKSVGDSKGRNRR